MNEIIEKPFDWNDLIYKITEEVIETEENFIFTTINPWCENVMQKKISKYDLERALALYFNGGTILDKIKAEIEEYKSRQLASAIGIEDLEKGKQIALEYVLAILDKYKAESEE